MNTREVKWCGTTLLYAIILPVYAIVILCKHFLGTMGWEIDASMYMTTTPEFVLWTMWRLVKQDGAALTDEKTTVIDLRTFLF
jgi:hypothetical protein